MLSSLQQKVEQLQPRERWLLIVGIPIIIILAGYIFVAKPLSEQLNAAENRLARAEAVLESAISQNRSSASCSNSGSLADSSTTQIISEAAQRLGMRVATTASSQISVQGTRGDWMLAFAEQLACAGLKIEAFSVQKFDTPSDGQLPFEATIQFPSGVATP